MTTAIIYTNDNQECDRIKTLLKTLPSITEILEYKLGKHFEKYQFEMEFGGDASYPQVAIGTKHIGSMKDTLNYLNINGMFL